MNTPRTVTPDNRDEWDRYQAANRRARLAYAAQPISSQCGRPTRTGEPCLRPVDDEAGVACPYHWEAS